MNKLYRRKRSVLYCITVTTLGLVALFCMLLSVQISNPAKRPRKRGHRAIETIDSRFVTRSPFGSKLWLQFYPEVGKLLSLIQDGTVIWPVPLNGTTSAWFTRLVLKEKPTYYVGDILEATLEVKDGLDQRKSYGGDYFFARLMRTNDSGETLGSGVACDVVDKGDGTYTISAPLLWAGRATLFVDMVHPSEAIVQLVRQSATGVGKGLHFVSTYPSGERVLCNVGLKPKHKRFLCDFSLPDKGFTWFCETTLSGVCPGVVTYTEVKTIKSKVMKLGTQPLFERGCNWNTPIKQKGLMVQVKQSMFVENFLKTLPLCEASSSMSEYSFQSVFGKHSGFYLNNEWQSLQCKSRLKGFNPTECLKNKSLYLIGDSTMRQWYNAFLDILTLDNFPSHVLDKRGKDVWQVPRTGYNRGHNISVFYRAHGLPLYNPGPPGSHPFIVDTLKSIQSQDGSNTLVVINLALHFLLIDPIYYMQRVDAVKRSVEELQHRVPGIRIFIRGCIRHRNTYVTAPTEWYSFRLCKILRAAFELVPNVGFIDTWQMTTVFPNDQNIHPTKESVNKHVMAFLSYLC